MKITQILSCMMLLTMLLTVPSAQAMSPTAQPPVPDFIQQAMPDARLSGEGNDRWFGLKVYHAQLWVGEKGIQANTPYTDKFILHIRYDMNFYGKTIAERCAKEIAELGIGTPDEHKRWLEIMVNMFPEVDDGTVLAGEYLPDTGVRFYLDGKPLKEISDNDFAKAFFAIWLDEKTSVPDLRRELLGNKNF